MPKVWKNNKRDAKDLVRRARKGDVYYTIVDIATNLAPYEDKQLLDRWKVTSIQAFTGAPMCGSKGLEQVLYESGAVYAERPRGYRGIWESAPQVAGPLGNEETENRPLDKIEIRGLRKRIRDNTAEQKKANRRSWL